MAARYEIHASPTRRLRTHGATTLTELVTPAQSASVVGSVTSLASRTTLSVRSSASPSLSPQRQITQLRTARPPITLYPLAAALFAGIEVKSPSGNLQEAQLQMSIWMAASIHKKAELAWSAFATDALPHRPDHGTLSNPASPLLAPSIRSIMRTCPNLTLPTYHMTRRPAPSQSSATTLVCPPRHLICPGHLSRCEALWQYYGLCCR